MRDVRAHTHYRRWWRVARALQQRGHLRTAYRAERLLRVVYGGDLSTGVDLTDVVLMHNGLGVVLHQDTEFRGRAVVFQHVTFGDSGKAAGAGRIAPTVGDRVFVGANAVVVGPVTIGDDCVIGAGTVVTTDVPSGSRVVGSPARITPLTSTALLDDWFGPRRGAQDGPAAPS